MFAVWCHTYWRNTKKTSDLELVTTSLPHTSAGNRTQTETDIFSSFTFNLPQRASAVGVQKEINAMDVQEEALIL